MSQQTSIVYGYGFPIDGLYKDKKAAKRLKVFLNKHGLFPVPDDVNTIEEIEEHILNIHPKYAECMVSGRAGIGGLIANIMTKETEIRYEYQPSMQESPSDKPVIMVSECMPWTFTDIEKEKLKSENALFDLTKPYMKELGVPKEEFGQQAIEYWG